MKRARLIALALVAFVCLDGFAAAGPPDVSDLLGKTVVAKLGAPVREAPPAGYLALPGKRIGALVANGTYRIKDAKVFPHLFSTQTWVLLVNGKSQKEVGWSYFGENATNYVNFKDSRE